MKQRVIEITSKLFLVVVLGLSLIGMTMANVKPQQQVSAKRQQAVETLHRQIFNGKQNLNKLSQNGGVISEANRINFDIGQRFALAKFDTQGLDEFEASYFYLVVGLVELIDKLEGSPESAELQNLLKSIVRNEIDNPELEAELERISQQYLATQSSEQQWYFNSGLAVTDIVSASYLYDEEWMKKGLAQMQTLIKTAPEGTPEELLNPMGELVKYVAQTTFTEEDFYAIGEGAMVISESVIA